jgi:hypothetical protein
MHVGLQYTWPCEGLCAVNCRPAPSHAIWPRSGSTRRFCESGGRSYVAARSASRSFGRVTVPGLSIARRTAVAR